MKLRAPLSLITFFLCFLCAPAYFGQTATIAAWNVEGFEPIAPNKTTRLIRAIRNLSPDVIVLTEVNPDSVATDIKNGLAGYSVKMLPQNATQNIAILHKNAVSVTNLQLIDRSDDNNDRLRKALAANVRIGNFDFILIGVHMKAGRPNSRPNPQPVRTRQARAIANFIRQQTNGDEKDVLVVGDYNMVPGQDNANFHAMSPGSGNNEFLSYISNQSLTGRVSHINSCNQGQARGNLLDGFAISKSFTSEYVNNSLRIVNFDDSSVFTSETGTPFNCTTFTGFLSDHLPLIATFRTNQPDVD